MRIHGKRGQVLMQEVGATVPPFSTATEVADMSAFTLNLTTEKVPVTAFGDTNVVKVTGLPDFAGTLAGWWNKDTSPRLFDVILAGLPVGLKLVPDELDVATTFFEGLAYIDGSIDVSATGAVSFAGTWDAAANWVMTAP